MIDQAQTRDEIIEEISKVENIGKLLIKWLEIILIEIFNELECLLFLIYLDHIDACILLHVRYP